MSEPPFSRVAVVGLGLIGGSIAQAIRRAWPGVAIVGVDRPSVAAEARGRAAIDDTRSAVDQLDDVDLIVLATPVPEIVDLIAQAGRSELRAVITDVGSTKRPIVDAAKRTGLTFVGGHPVAGSAHGGLDHARADLFDGHPWLLVEVTPGVISSVEAFVRGLGALPRRVDAETHDRVMAYVSHLPQLLSSVLMRTAGRAVGEDGLTASGRGFADMTRLAASPPELWRGILSSNADFVLEAIQAFVAALPATVDDFDNADGLEAVLREANRLAQRQNQRAP